MLQDSHIEEVVVTSDVFRSCLYHSYLTQSEEVAGLLLGNQESLGNGKIRVYCLASITN